MVGTACPPYNLTGVRSPGAIGRLGSCLPRFRALGPGRSAVLALISHSARKERGACAIFRGLGRRARHVTARSRRISPDLKLHMHAAMDALRVQRASEARGWRAARCMPVPNPALRDAAGLRSAAVKLTDAIGLGSMLGKAQIVRHWIVIFCTCGVVLSLRAPGPAKSGKTKRDRGAGCHGFSS
jgi:hypothetical protein